MAGSSMTFTYDNRHRLGRIICTWTSDDATGAVSATTSFNVYGYLIKGTTDPGTPAPTDNYDITLSDDYSVDLLASSVNTLANRHTTTTQNQYFGLTNATTMISAFPVVAGPITVAVANAGNSKQGVIILYFDGEIES